MYKENRNGEARKDGELKNINDCKTIESGIMKQVTSLAVVFTWRLKIMSIGKKAIYRNIPLNKSLVLPRYQGQAICYLFLSNSVSFK